MYVTFLVTAASIQPRFYAFSVEHVTLFLCHHGMACLKATDGKKTVFKHAWEL
jgi:hypothetical protein